MVQLEQWRSQFELLGVQVAAVAYDNLDIIQSFSEEAQLNYPLMHDVDAAFVEALGIRNETYEQGHKAYGIPHPGLLWLAADGRIQAKFAVPGYRTRVKFEDVEQAISASIAPANGPD